MSIKIISAFFEFIYNISVIKIMYAISLQLKTLIYTNTIINKHYFLPF